MPEPIKYILVGGYPRGAADGGQSFCTELVRGLASPAKILDCLFARPKATWPKAFAEDCAFFAKTLLENHPQLILASPEHFAEQVTAANAVYFRGGRTKSPQRRTAYHHPSRR